MKTSSTLIAEETQELIEEKVGFTSQNILRIVEKGICKSYLPFSIKDNPLSALYNLDCAEGMKHFPSNYFDLAIVDPEYGIDAANMTMGRGKNKKYSKKDWDKKPPDKKYFDELFRVSKNQIIWGGNYFTDKLYVSRGWIIWDKMLNKDVSFGDGELAWSSFDRAIKTVKIQYNGFLGAEEVRIHPTQKPVKLYNWTLRHYAKKGQRILDTHVGSGSSRIACFINGFDFVGFEIDPEYCKESDKRFNNAILKQTFEFEEFENNSDNDGVSCNIVNNVSFQLDLFQ